jgi:hypothetical protein
MTVCAPGHRYSDRYDSLDEDLAARCPVLGAERANDVRADLGIRDERVRLLKERGDASADQLQFLL